MPWPLLNSSNNWLLEYFRYLFQTFSLICDMKSTKISTNLDNGSQVVGRNSDEKVHKYRSTTVCTWNSIYLMAYRVRVCGWFVGQQLYIYETSMLAFIWCLMDTAKKQFQAWKLYCLRSTFVLLSIFQYSFSKDCFE